SIIKRIEDFEINIKKASENSTFLNTDLNKINYQIFPDEYQEQFGLLREKSNYLELFLVDLETLTFKLKTFLGKDRDKRYLLVFQNTGEKRATGGFIGSFALAEFSEGRLKNIEIPEGGSYDVDGGLNRLIPAPEPLQLVTDRWYFRDSNWWPDWPTSAEKLMWFYEASGGPTVDGCISFTPEVLSSILDITGPLDMTEDYGIIITKDNFWDNIRKSIEEEKEIGDNKPKKIINDLFAKIIEKLPGSLDQEKLTNFLVSTRDNLKSKDILFYFKDPLLQEEVEKRSWAGKIKDTNNDYLSVVNTNIAGGKSDRQIEQEINHQVEILKDGTVVDTLKIVRKHIGVSSQYFYGNRNVNWIRIYVPLGSRLIKAGGFEKPSEIYFEHPPSNWEKDELIKQEEDYALVDPDSDTRIYQENNKTVFANWSMVDPGEEDVIILKYELPFKIKEEERDDTLMERVRENIIGDDEEYLLPYSLLIQKQAGTRHFNINSKLILPDNSVSTWAFPENIKYGDKGWEMSSELNEDKFLAILFSKK
ncbi:DUF4012 domain-containing protein, partial [bacterium]|nr:DUF4012 domain-containing protein [bacterium]